MGGSLDPATLEVKLNDVSILDRITGGPIFYTARIALGEEIGHRH